MRSQELHLLRLVGKSVLQRLQSSQTAMGGAAYTQVLWSTGRSYTAGLHSLTHGTVSTSPIPASSRMHIVSSPLSCRLPLLDTQHTARQNDTNMCLRCAHTEAGSDQQSNGTETPGTKRRVERRPHWSSEMSAEDKAEKLLERLAELEIFVDYDLTPGEWSKNMLCPQCQGGDRGEKSFVIKVAEDCESAFYKCHRANKCNWKGSVLL